MFAYFVLVFIFLIVWFVLFFNRKDLRKKMIIASLAVIPLGVFDYLSQPAYWHPPTFFSLPVGIEGVLFGFAFGGVASVLYEEIAGVHLKKYRSKKQKVLSHIMVPISIFLISFGLYFLFHINMMVSLPIGISFGLFLVILIRPNLKIPILFSALYFGVLYLLLLSFWFMLFPHAILWWNLNIYSNITILGVPLGEVLFGFLYGAIWGSIYEFLFDYRLVSKV